MQFSTGRLVRRSVWFHSAMSIAVALGVATATAVVSGALLVGDSMRGSLRQLTLERLGAIDYVVTPGGFFDAKSASKLGNASLTAVPVIQFARAVVESENADDEKTDSDSPRIQRAGNVQIVASGPEFWELDTAGVRPQEMPGNESVVLNQAAADELGVGVGDLVTVRLPTEQAVPADSPLGRRESTSEGIPRLKVVSIVPNRGLGRFSLQPSQTSPLVAYLSLNVVREVLDRPAAINTVLISAPTKNAADKSSIEELIEQNLDLQLSDFGLRVERHQLKFPQDEDANQQPIYDYYSLTSDRLLINDVVASLVSWELGDSAQPVMTYLANAIETADGTISVPYSTISAINSSDNLPLDFIQATQPSNTGETSTKPVPIVINSWLAERLSAQQGTQLKIFYYEPETSAGREIENSFDGVVADVVPITKPKTPYRRTRPATFDQLPTRYNDPNLTPSVPGVTDQDSISDWDLPFQLEREISREDDDYWAEYRLTPKAFMPLETGQSLFGSRFGNVSSFRIDAGSVSSLGELENRLVRALRREQQGLGFSAIPIKAQQLAASRGTTPFDALFLSLSFFVIVAALMLVSLLFRLGMEQRATEYGILIASGLPNNKVATIALTEGTLIAVPGAFLGILGGIAYAFAVLLALKTLWVGAVTVPFLEFHWTPTSILIGFAAGILMTIATILLTTRRLRKADVRPLLSGRIPEGNRRHFSRAITRYLSIACLLVAVGLGIFAIFLTGPAQAGAFVGGGMLLMCGLLGLIYNYLADWNREMQRPELSPGFALNSLAVRSVSRNPMRSTLSIGLMAVACFLIVSMSAFQMSPTERGTGGFDLIGQSAVPLYKDLGDVKVRDVLLGRDAIDDEQAKFFGLRFRPGQDASCNNLYQASQPQVLGVPSSFIDWFASESPDGAIKPKSFEWAASGTSSKKKSESERDVSIVTPWQHLSVSATGTESDPVPVILDQNTALWSLQMRGGVGEVRGFRFDDGRTRFFKVVALLGNTTLQGSLIIDESNFERLFPEVNGYSYFLIQLRDGLQTDKVASTLEFRLGDVGMDVRESRVVLANLMAVQNTYLRTFQSLGALGLLLGTFGLAVVQLRNVLERRGELALMRALGFPKSKLAFTVLAENATLLLTGIGCGAFAALAAVIPYFISASTSPSIAEPLVMLAIVTSVGLLAALVAVRRVLRMRLLDSL